MGVKPMVVSTEMPRATAASEAPAPRCAVTNRSLSVGRPMSTPALRLAHAWLSP